MADVFQVNGNDSSCMVCACAMWPVWTDLECATSTVMPCVNRCLVHECAVEQSMGGLSMFSSEFGVLQDHRLELSGCCGRPQGVNRQPACTSGNGVGEGNSVRPGWMASHHHARFQSAGEQLFSCRGGMGCSRSEHGDRSCRCFALASFGDVHVMCEADGLVQCKT